MWVAYTPGSSFFSFFFFLNQGLVKFITHLQIKPKYSFFFFLLKKCADSAVKDSNVKYYPLLKDFKLKEFRL